MLLLPTGDWPDRSTPARLARLGWTLGLAMLLLHILLAFWLAHGWSHDAAVRHTREVGGDGWGIVVNYVFVAMWLADVVWWWINPASYASRPRWLGGLVHGFLVFVTFNATVIFGLRGPCCVYGPGFVALGWLCMWPHLRAKGPNGGVS